MVADHSRDDSMATIAARILAAAPPRFALAGLSMGGYIAHDHCRPSARARRKSSRCSTPRRGPKRRSRARGASPRSRSPKAAGSPRSRRCSFHFSSIATGKATKRSGSGRAHHGRGDGSASLPAPAAGDHDAGRCTAAVAVDQMPDPGAGRRRRRAHAAGAVRGDRGRHRRIAARRRARLRAPLDAWSGRKR